MPGRILLGPLFGEFGGVSQHVRQLNRYVGHPHEAFRLPPWSLYHPSWSNISWRWEARRVAFPDPFALAVARRARRFELLHLHAFPFWFRAYIEPAAPQIKRVYTLHQIFFEEDFDPASWSRWRETNGSVLESMKDAHRIITVSRWHLPLLAKVGIEATWIPNGADPEEVASADGNRFRARFGIREPFYLWAAALLRYKRPALFLGLAERKPDRAFVMVGQGVSKVAVENLLGRAASPNVRILGQLPRRDFLDALAASRVFVLPSARETFSVAVMEALAAGKPVVAARGTGASDILEDGRTGFLFEPDNIQDLETASDRAWEHPEAGEAARRLVMEQFTWDKVAARLDDLYDEVLGA